METSKVGNNRTKGRSPGSLKRPHGDINFYILGILGLYSQGRNIKRLAICTHNVYFLGSASKKMNIMLVSLSSEFNFQS